MSKRPYITKLNAWYLWQTPRWKTAITRRKEGNYEQYSSPMAIAIQQGIIDHNHTVLDYGCGKGGDLRRLQAEGYRANGFAPTGVRERLCLGQLMCHSFTSLMSLRIQKNEMNC